ncbi:hypothetical protein ARMGADRAFT_135150 [Armillaria gallica]|uniref:Uncharacterized protein n=1 Tax=Armillaria gallica TaxID=47427 RepID=A0A2H3CDN5_ARMGA|nr:hypothetical protein ARMGADRAFT_135150 [Armillaria gallica]
MRILGPQRETEDIMPPLYYDYLGSKKKHSAEAAKQVIQFRLSHSDELIGVAEEESLTEESQCLKVDIDEGVFEELRRSWSAIWKSCRARRVAGVRWRDWRECNLRTGCAGSSRRRAGRYIHIGSLRRSCQDCSRRTRHPGYTCTFPVFPSMTTSFIPPAAISTPNTLSTLPMHGRPTSAGKDRSCSRPYDGTVRWNGLKR